MFYPVDIPITIISRSTFDEQYQFIDTITGDVIDITDYDFSSQIWDFRRETKFADFNVTKTNSAEGIIELSLTPLQTADLSGAAFYDIKFVLPDGRPYYFVKGSVTIQRGYT